MSYVNNYIEEILDALSFIQKKLKDIEKRLEKVEHRTDILWNTDPEYLT